MDTRLQASVDRGPTSVHLIGLPAVPECSTHDRSVGFHSVLGIVSVLRFASRDASVETAGRWRSIQQDQGTNKQLHHEGASWGPNVWKTIITVPQREQGQREASALALLIAVGECGRLS